VPVVNTSLLRMYPGAGNHLALEARRRFYQTVHPENIPLAVIVGAYKKMAQHQGFRLLNCFEHRRNDMIRYLVLDLVRTSDVV
jgi:hypothetical protein